MLFPHVFQPLQLRHRTLTSRINFGAHTANMAEDGLPGDRHVGYYRERALGGAGMIVVEADVPLRARFVAAGGSMRQQTVVLAWDQGGATIRSTLNGAIERLPADTLVIAETPVAETSLATELTAQGIAFHEIGDCVSPRRASLAFFDGRELARRL